MSGNTSRAAAARNLTLIRRNYTSSSSSSTSSSYCASATPLSHKYLTNGGIVEGVWLFHRHGDRAPNRPLCADHMIEQESSFWRTKIPASSSSSSSSLIDDHLNEFFPPNLHPSHAQFGFLDAKREPFGRLTHKGLQQMKTTGMRFGLRYEQYGHHARRRKEQIVSYNGAARKESGGRVMMMKNTGGGGDDFLEYWNVKAYSTNYLRTITSCQSFLDGVFTSSSSSSSNSSSSSSYGMPSDYTNQQQQQQQVPINVRDRSSDTLNAFDREPTLMQNLVAKVLSCPQFTKRDAKAAPLAARLANFLPGLNIHKHKKNQQPKLFGEMPPPSNINWIHATDHFVCRSSHSLPYTAYSAHEDDDVVESTMAAMAEPTLAHLAWRFRQWYLNKELLSVVAAPPLREMEGQIRAAPFLGVEERRPFVVYSCHDVTLLSLLYGIGADFLMEKKKKKQKKKKKIGKIKVNGYGDRHEINGSTKEDEDDEDEEDDWGSWRWWPAYASTLAFELVRVDEKGTGMDSHIIRIFLNGKPLRVVDPFLRDGGVMDDNDDNNNNEDDFSSSNNSRVNGVESVKALTLSDFSRIVKYLEDVGGRGRGSKNKEEEEDDDEEEERDMSIWTG